MRKERKGRKMFFMGKKGNLFVRVNSQMIELKKYGENDNKTLLELHTFGADELDDVHEELENMTNFHFSDTIMAFIIKSLK